MRWLLLAALTVAIYGCANPLNRVTSDRYFAQCAAAERAGDLRYAEQLCYRSLVNVDWGNLGPELKSKRLYNLAQIKRRLSKFNEAEDLLRASLKLEEGISGPTSVPVGRRLAELSINLASLDRWAEGIPFVERILPIAESYSGGERSFLSILLRQYAERARAMGNSELATAFEAKANAL